MEWVRTSMSGLVRGHVNRGGRNKGISLLTNYCDITAVRYVLRAQFSVLAARGRVCVAALWGTSALWGYIARCFGGCYGSSMIIHGGCFEVK